MKKQSGFTLIELMVVMAIIAILATAGLTAYSNYLKKARDSARAQTARALMTKVEELANGGPLPTPAQLLEFLIAENFAPIDSNGKLKIDPLDGGTSCFESYSYTYTMECIFTYGTISDGTYYISYPIEHSDSMENFWITPQAIGVNNGNYSAGNIIGTNPYIIEDNYQYDGTGGSWLWSQGILSSGSPAFYPVMPTYTELVISSNPSNL